MDNLKSFWGWLDGRKTKLAALFWIIKEQIVPIWFSDGVPDRLEKVLSTIAVALFSLGLGHAMVKKKLPTPVVPVLLVALFIGACTPKAKFDFSLAEPPPAVQKEKEILEGNPAPRPETVAIQQTPIQPTEDHFVVAYGFDRADIRSGEYHKIQAIQRIMELEPERTCQIIGAACPIGEDNYNLQLGLRRANAVRNALVSGGVDITKIYLHSIGETDLVSIDPEQYALNRRAEVTLK